jgi:hypothetical protein
MPVESLSFSTIGWIPMAKFLLKCETSIGLFPFGFHPMHQIGRKRPSFASLV